MACCWRDGVGFVRCSSPARGRPDEAVIDDPGRYARAVYAYKLREALRGPDPWVSAGLAEGHVLDLALGSAEDRVWLQQVVLEGERLLRSLGVGDRDARVIWEVVLGLRRVGHAATALGISRFKLYALVRRLRVTARELGRRP